VVSKVPLEILDGILNCVYIKNVDKIKKNVKNVKS